ncbi:unnamed protein product [Hydatigera taeniaeformis]|uniref:Uncharacterized protein n=1 Tax=Hydatigena taeniaeformis TaxID=6205 RepID=A0A0R3WQ38_HYDTA|nr:unnamed protein product [Hydatigera taeniaeformis]
MPECKIPIYTASIHMHVSSFNSFFFFSFFFFFLLLLLPLSPFYCVQAMRDATKCVVWCVYHPFHLGFIIITIIITTTTSIAADVTAATAAVETATIFIGLPVPRGTCFDPEFGKLTTSLDATRWWLTHPGVGQRECSTFIPLEEECGTGIDIK